MFQFPPKILEFYQESAWSRHSLADVNMNTSTFKAVFLQSIDGSSKIQLVRNNLPDPEYSGIKLVQYVNIAFCSIWKWESYFFLWWFITSTFATVSKRENDICLTLDWSLGRLSALGIPVSDISESLVIIEVKGGILQYWKWITIIKSLRNDQFLYIHWLNWRTFWRICLAFLQLCCLNKIKVFFLEKIIFCKTYLDETHL